MMTGRKMKKIFILIIALTFILSAASLSFADEFQVKGTVTKITDKRITVADDKGKETTVESNENEIKVGDGVLLKIEISKPAPALDLKLSKQDIEFLTKQCRIDPADVNVIPKLNRRAKSTIRVFLSESDCTLMEPFKQTREFLKKFTPPPEQSPLPPQYYSRDYLTEEEGNYITEINSRIIGLKIKKIEFKIEGTVKRISGNLITIADNKGEETTVESSGTYLKIGDAVVLKVQFYPN